MKMLGAALLMLGALLISRRYRAYVQRCAGEVEGFIDFLEYMRGKIYCYLEPPERWIDSFRSEALEKCGFLCELRGGEDMKNAYAKVKNRLGITDAADRLLTEFFGSAGGGYLESELRGIDYCLDGLRRIREESRPEEERRCRIVTVMAVCVSVGLVILFI